MVSNKNKHAAWARACAFALVMTAVPAIAAPPAQGSRSGNDCGFGLGYGMMGGYGVGMMGGEGMGMMGGEGMGMMGGFGPGHGMMGPFGWDRGPDLKLSPEQRTKINGIMDETRKAHWSLMGAMMDQHARLRDLYAAPNPDKTAIDDTYKAIGKLREQMYNSSVDARKRMEGLLTKEQQQTLHNYWQ
uniref:Spy/CpxP family protein refolding chaperone n=1 Tax=Cupriavidus pinatubonensis TaxID=248026 RepID=UPI0035932643